MQQSYVRTLLYSISTKMGRKPQEMDRFIQTLEEQWYDSQEALAKLQPTDYTRLQIPERLGTMIAEAVGAAKPQPARQQRMQIESPIESELGQLRSRLQGPDFAEVVEMLSRIFNNIRQNLINDKFKTLKKSNAKIEALTGLREVVRILKHGGFEDVGPSFVLTKVNIGLIDECIESISKFQPSREFNPYKSHISSLGKTSPDNYEGPSSVKYNTMLEDLERERTRIMSQPIADRRVRVYQVEPQAMKEFDRQFQEENESQEEDKHMELARIKAMLKRQGEEPKFINRREQEYQQLIKKPVFTETTVRVKLPDSWIFECRFSPLEKLQVLLQIFKDCLEYKNLDYYIYMTPPVQKISGVRARKTFYDLGCIPRAIFYMKTDQKISGNIFRVKRTMH